MLRSAMWLREILKSNNNLFGSKLSKKIASLPDCCDNRFGFEFLSFNKGCVYTPNQVLKGMGKPSHGS